MRALLVVPILALVASAQTPLPELPAESEAAVLDREVERCIAGPMPVLPGGDTAPLPALPLGGPAPAPMPTWCPEPARLAAFPEGLTFSLRPPELDPYDFDTLSDESLRRSYLDELRDRYPLFDPRPTPITPPALAPLGDGLLHRIQGAGGD